MYKKCEEILKKLEREEKIKVSDYQFPQKQELKLRLKDMLEDEVDEKYYLSNKMIEYITTNDSKLKQVGQIYGTEREPNPQAGRIYDSNGISPTMDSCSGGNRMPKILIKNATKQGYLEATDGDSVNLAYPKSKTRRGRVGEQVSQTLQTNDNMGVVINDTTRTSDNEITDGGEIERI